MKKKIVLGLEGLDSSGKTTAATALKKYFQRRGIGVTLIKNPRETQLGRSVFLLTKKTQLACTFVSAVLHSGVNIDINKLVEESKNRIVILDRTFLSTLAYGCNSKEEARRIYELNHGLALDKLAFFDISYETFKKRMSARKKREDEIEKKVANSFEKKKKRYHQAMEFVPNGVEKMVVNEKWGKRKVLNELVKFLKLV